MKKIIVNSFLRKSFNVPRSEQNLRKGTVLNKTTNKKKIVENHSTLFVKTKPPLKFQMRRRQSRPLFNLPRLLLLHYDLRHAAPLLLVSQTLRELPIRVRVIQTPLRVIQLLTHQPDQRNRTIVQQILILMRETHTPLVQHTIIVIIPQHLRCQVRETQHDLPEQRNVLQYIRQRVANILVLRKRRTARDIIRRLEQHSTVFDNRKHLFRYHVHNRNLLLVAVLPEALHRSQLLGSSSLKQLYI